MSLEPSLEPSLSLEPWYVAHVPLEGLQPGRYLLQLTMSATGITEPIVRELAFDVINRSK